MNRYSKTFNKLKRKKEKALVPFVVAGDPNYKISLDIVKTIINAGADIIEIGQNFSDPIADGPTIQAADLRAAKAGINTDKFFDFIKQIREFNQEIPIGILIYANLIYQRGIKKFYYDAARAGIDSILVADLPVEESDEYLESAKKHKISTVFIVSPLTSNERLTKIAKKTKGFIYAVSRLGVTGARQDIQEGTLKLLKRIRPKTKLPLCVGFGISMSEHIQAICKAGADGTIVGSAVVKIIEKNLKNKKTMLNKIEKYIEQLKAATK